MLTTVKFASRLVGVAPFGSSTLLMWIDPPISRPVMSTTTCCGMLSGSHRNSISCRTRLSTPPRLMPGEACSFFTTTGTLTWILESLFTRWKSACRILS